MSYQFPFPITRTQKSKLNDLDFNNLKFGEDFSDHMFVAQFDNGTWSSAEIKPFEAISFSPAAAVFHYGQAIFEGLKAHRSSNGDILLFRPKENLVRMNKSAIRMSMVEIPEELFMEGIKKLVELDQDWIPEGEGMSLYIRPFLIADEAFLGVKASTSYKFIVITSPASNYYKGAVNVKIETEFSRAASGGIGAAKAAANYAASLFPATKAKQLGYDQLIWTDSKEHRYLEESGTMNLMMIIDDVLITPSLEGSTILPGITRKSILYLARNWGLKVEERRIQVDELISALKNNSLQEIFGVGTAATLVPIKNIGYLDQNYPVSDFSSWNFANKAKNYLEQLKRGSIKDEFGWIVKA